MDLVEAQEARRVLDRLYGYEVSPVLWKKVMSGLSAGRVQSVATRLVVDRERERMAFQARVLLGHRGHLRRRRRQGTADVPGQAPLDRRGAGRRRLRLRRRRAAQGQEGRHGSTSTAPRPRVSSRRSPTRPSRSARSRPSPTAARPYAPFRTTTLQQEASRKLGMSASVTMSVAQRLYENGFITYMRTDSTTLSGGAVEAARSQVRELYGAEYLPDAPRTYASKVKNAQEAHEAIRPAGETFRTPAQTGLTGRAVPALRADLDAHRGLADEGRRRPVGLGPDRRRRLRRPRRRLLGLRPGHHVPRVPQGLRRGHRRGQAQRRRPGAAARARRGRRRLGRDAQRQRPRDQAAGPLHRGHADQGARGARDRPAVDVRLDHRDDHQPRLRLQEGHRPGAGLDRVLHDPAAGGALPAPDLLRVHRADGGRPRRHRRRPQGPRERAGRVLLRLRAGAGAARPDHQPRRDRRP